MKAPSTPTCACRATPDPFQAFAWEALRTVASQKPPRDTGRLRIDRAALRRALGGRDEILEAIMDAAVRITVADRGFLMLFDRSDELQVKIARNMNYAGLPEEERKISQSVVEEVLRDDFNIHVLLTAYQHLYVFSQDHARREPRTVGAKPFDTRRT